MMLPVISILIEKGLPLLADTVVTIVQNSGVGMATDYLKRKLSTDVDLSTKDPDKLKEIGDLIDKHKDRLVLIEEDLQDMDELIGLHHDHCLTIEEDLQDLKKHVDIHSDDIDNVKQDLKEHVDIVNSTPIVDTPDNTLSKAHIKMLYAEDVFIRRFVPIFSIILFCVSILLIAGIVWIPTTNPNMANVESSVLEFAKNIVIMISSYYLGSSQSSQNKLDTITKMNLHK